MHFSITSKSLPNVSECSIYWPRLNLYDFFQVICNAAIFVLKVLILCSISELDGYVVVVSTFTSISRNKFFDAKLKISERKSVTVFILKQVNQAITKTYVRSLR